jgi:ATP-binding cassette, subfamily B, bacterial MsbA
LSQDITPQPMASTRVLLSRLVRHHVRPYFGRLALAMICMAIAAGATAGLAQLMEPVLDRVFIDKDESILVMITLAVLVIALVKGLVTYFEGVLMGYVGQRIIADLQTRLFAHLIHFDLAFFHDAGSGRLISRFTNDINAMRNAVSQVLTGLIKDALTLIFLVAVMFEKDWKLALIAFVVFPTAIYPIVRIGRRMRKISTDVLGEAGRFTARLNEAFQGARHVKAYNREGFETERTATVIENMFRIVYKSYRVRALSSPIMETLGGIAVAAIIFYGGWQVIDGGLTPGGFFSFVTALLLAYKPMKSLANLNTNLQEGLAASQRLFHVLDMEPTIKDGPETKALAVSGGAVALDGVSFAYHENAPALSDVSLDIPAGKMVALVGPSGAGKSTILNLIPRFYDVSAGTIRIDGQDVRDVTLESLRDALALVSQESVLFDDSVRANIAYGRAGASDAEIEAAAQGAAAHDFITRLPDGYDTMIGEGGVKLSGGQRQRLSIARAMLKNAPILLLDEATSELDSESERKVQRALAELMRERTTLVIAHRLSTVIGADRIYTIEQGRIVESGTHAELLAKNGAYARLYALQFAGEAAE